MQLFLITDGSIECSLPDFDSRNGFGRIVFGLDAYEDCALLREIECLLQIDLTLIRYPASEIFEKGIELNLFLELVKNFRAKLQTKSLPGITYKYIDHSYLQSGLEQDLQLFESFTECALTQGAKTIRFEISWF